MYDKKYRKKNYSIMKSQRRNQMIILSIAVLGICIISLFIYVVRTVPEFNQYRLVRTYSTDSTETKRLRTILLWNDFFGDKRWSLPDDTMGPTDFRDVLNCPTYQCELSNNHDFLPSVDMYDAIVFHTAAPFPLLHPVPSTRSMKQLFVFALMESPGETKHILNDEINFYNLTMSYRLDSDIVWPYKSIVDIETGAFIAPAKQPLWRHPPTRWNDSKISETWSSKTNNVAWFVSHCNTLSNREKLAKALQQHIDVDIFGKCGTKSCSRENQNACDEMLDQKYKFYLSFENSLCVDYVTEKLYNAFNRYIIPVVFGGANYTRFVPPHSYINAESFASVKDLALYLKFLSNNIDEYMSYFWWRKYYRIGNPPSPFCKLCEKLNDQNSQEKSQVYRNIERWWIQGSCRFEANIKY